MIDSEQTALADLAKILPLEDLSDKEIFSFLKRYYTDSYKTTLAQKMKIQKGIFRETIETLEKLNERLEQVSDFIGYDKLDWEEACSSKNEVKKKQIVEFYNGLVVNVELMKLANEYYKLPPKIDAFIGFLDKEKSCSFRGDIQNKKWTIEDFPDEEIFETISKYRVYLRDQKNHRYNFEAIQGKQAACKVLEALKGAKKITQGLVVLKVQVLDLDQEEIEKIVQFQQVDPIFAKRSVAEKLRFLVEDLNNLDFGIDLPWLCLLTKGEIELNGEVRFMLGFILDSSNQKISTNQIIASLQSEVDAFLHEKVIDPFIRWEIIAIDQVFDHIGVKGIQEFILSNHKKLSLMLKWFVGLFYGVGKVISPDNHTAESRLVTAPIRLITRKAEVHLKDRNDTKKPKRPERDDLEKKSYDFNSVWDDTSLVKYAPEYTKSIHKFYEMLENSEGLERQQIKILQRVNLFLAYLNDGCLDNLATGLSINPNPSKWPSLVRMYLALLDNSRDIDFSGIANWTICNTSLLQRNLSRSSLRHQLHDRNLAEVTDLIAQELEDLKQSNISIPQSKLCYMEKLAQKNAISARRYLKNSFKENTVLLRFKIDNSESRLDISSLKIIITQFLKKAKRAPKSIGAHLDAYIGYFVLLEGRYYSIDCTAIFYLCAEAVVEEVKSEFENYWKEFTKRYTAKQEVEQKLPDLKVIPTLWFKEGGSQYFVVNKRDKLIPQLRNDLVSFYTAYEYFSGYKNTRHSDHKRPELFLRGRIKKTMPKTADEKKTPQDEVSKLENKTSVNEINGASSQQEPNGQSDISESRIESILRSLLPL